MRLLGILGIVSGAIGFATCLGMGLFWQAGLFFLVAFGSGELLD